MSQRQQQEIHRGGQAKVLAENELLNEILNKMDADILAGWRNSEAADHEGRHNAYLMSRILADFRRRLGVIQKTGEAAEKAARTGMVELD